MSEFHYVRTTGVDGGVDAVNGPAIGIDLESILADGLPPFKVALEIIAALCEILDIADQDGEVHGDLAPDWVFIDDTGAVSVEGFGIKRDETMAPEGRPRGTATDLYGLGYLAYRVFAAEDIPEVDLEDPDLHDDDVIDSVLTINFEGMHEEIIGDVQWFIAKLMSFERDDRPTALEAWRSFIAFADASDGILLEEWAPDAVEGGGERRDAEEAVRDLDEAPPEAEAGEDLGGPVMTKGPLSRGGISFGGGGAKPGQATAFWSKEQMKAALEAEAEEEEYRPAAGGGSATAFWSKEQMEAMQRGDTEAPRPKRGGGQAQKRATMMVARSDMERAETQQKREQRAAAPKPPPPTPVQPPTPAAAPPPVAPPPVASGPASPPPVIGGPQASGPASPPPVIGGPQSAPAWDQDEEEEGGGGAMKFVIIGVVAVVLLLICGGVVIAVGGGAYFGLSGDDEVTVDIDEDDGDDADDADNKPEDTAVEEVEPKEDEPEPKPRPKPSSTSSGSTSSGSTSSGSTSSGSSSGSVRPSSSGSSSGSVRPSTRPAAPAAPSGPVTATVKTTQRGQLRCSDGQTVDVDGSVSLTFEPYAIPVTCMVVIDGKMGAVQFERAATVSCGVAGDEVSCR